MPWGWCGVRVEWLLSRRLPERHLLLSRGGPGVHQLEGVLFGRVRGDLSVVQSTGRAVCGRPRLLQRELLGWFVRMTS